MRIREAGQVTDNLWHLGREESGIYYLDTGDGAIVINGGMSYILPDVLAQMQELGLDPGKIKKILILHSHFDHVGIVPYFKRTWPGIEVIASEAAWATFAKPKAIEVSNEFNRLSAAQVNASDALARYDLEWRDDITGTVAVDGGRVALGGIALEITYTPGHSNCSMVAYEPVRKVLFASDAAGIPFKDALFPSMNTNMSQYLESLDKLKALPVSYLCADHCGYVTGDEAGRFIGMTIEEGHRWKAYLEKYYQKHGGDIEAAAREVTAAFFKQMPGYFIAPDIMESVFKQMLKYISKTRQ